LQVNRDVSWANFRGFPRGMEVTNQPPGRVTTRRRRSVDYLDSQNKLPILSKGERVKVGPEEMGCGEKSMVRIEHTVANRRRNDAVICTHAIRGGGGVSLGGDSEEIPFCFLGSLGLL